MKWCARLAALALLLTPALAAEPLRIGIAAPLSGPDSVFGDQIRVGVDQAAADINAAGGILGRKIKIVAVNDMGDPKKGVEVAKSLTGAGVDLVVGHFSSAVTVPASNVYAEAGALEITPSAMAPMVTDRGIATLFRTCGREDQQAEVAANFLRARHYDNVAIVHDRSPTGKAFADAVRKALGGGEAYYGSFAAEARDVSGLVGRIRASGARIVVWGGAPAGAALLAKQLRDAKAGIPLLGGLAIASDDFASLAGPAADGTFIVFPQDPRRRPAAADLVRKLGAKDDDPSGYTFYAYAAMQVIRQAAQAAQSVEPKALADKMHGHIEFETVVGPITFDAKGDPKVSDLTVYVWHKGPTGRMGFNDLAGT